MLNKHKLNKLEKANEELKECAKQIDFLIRSSKGTEMSIDIVNEIELTQIIDTLVAVETIDQKYFPLKLSFDSGGTLPNIENGKGQSFIYYDKSLHRKYKCAVCNNMFTEDDINNKFVDDECCIDTFNVIKKREVL